MDYLEKKLQATTIEMNDLEFKLNEQEQKNAELEEQIDDKIIIGKVTNIKGQRVWPLLVGLLTCQSRAKGTRPSAIAENIATQASMMSKNVKLIELPSDACVRRCRGKMRTFEECVASLRLAWDDE